MLDSHLEGTLEVSENNCSFKSALLEYGLPGLGSWLPCGTWLCYQSWNLYEELIFIECLLCVRHCASSINVLSEQPSQQTCKVCPLILIFQMGNRFQSCGARIWTHTCSLEDHRTHVLSTHMPCCSSGILCSTLQSTTFTLNSLNCSPEPCVTQKFCQLLSGVP